MVGGKARVEYQPGEYVKAPEWLSKEGYDLLVFDNLEKALKFIDDRVVSNYHQTEVWKCEIKKGKSKLPPVMAIDYLAWGKLSDSPFSTWPDGTVMAREVKITEPVSGIREKGVSGIREKGG